MKKIFLIVIAFFCLQASNAQIRLVDETIFSGFVGKYEIRMKLAIPYGGATGCFTVGEYYYMRDKGKIDLCSSSEDRIVESVKGKETGYFVLDTDWNKRVGETISGKWYSLLNTRSYPVVLKVISKGRN